MNFLTFRELVRLEQTLFGLPLMMGGALLPLADPDFLDSLPKGGWIHWLWVFPAFICARITGMAFNQLIDRHIDAKNPRTQSRTIPSGKVTPMQAARIAWAALLLFPLICWQINTFCFLLSPLIVFLLFFYSYMKRIHHSCHFVLGLIHLFGPVMASITISGGIYGASFCLGGVAFLLIVGNDIAYAIQDYEFDRAHHLHSMPSRFGIEKSLLMSKWIHVFCVMMLIATGWLAHLPLIYYGVIPVVSAALILFYRTLSKRSEKIELLFFLCNSIISFAIFLFIFMSIAWVVIS